MFRGLILLSLFLALLPESFRKSVRKLCPDFTKFQLKSSSVKIDTWLLFRATTLDKIARLRAILETNREKLSGLDSASSGRTSNIDASSQLVFCVSIMS